MAKRVTLLDPPPQDHSKAPIENVLDLTPVVDLGPVRFPFLLTAHRRGREC
jgi:acyl-coenzyme A thioesterase 1/2/4